MAGEGTAPLGHNGIGFGFFGVIIPLYHIFVDIDHFMPFHKRIETDSSATIGTWKLTETEKELGQLHRGMYYQPLTKPLHQQEDYQV